MNWWSGFTWCQSQGGHLATYQEICKSAPRTGGVDTCVNIKSFGIPSGFHWVASPSGTSQAYCFEIGGRSSTGSRSNTYPVICSQLSE